MTTFVKLSGRRPEEGDPPQQPDKESRVFWFNCRLMRPNYDSVQQQRRGNILIIPDNHLFPRAHTPVPTSFPGFLWHLWYEPPKRSDIRLCQN